MPFLVSKKLVWRQDSNSNVTDAQVLLALRLYKRGHALIAHDITQAIVDTHGLYQVWALSDLEFGVTVALKDL